MQRAVVFGDLSSDSTSDQYPTVTLCQGCISEDEARKEDQQIVSLDGPAEPDDGPCEWCGAEKEED